jgi:tetratricopeptide (TPR) repeat protein
LTVEKATRRPGGLRYEGIWIIGASVGLLFWTRRAWSRRIPAVRAASEYETGVFARAAGGIKAELRIVARELAPGAWGLWRGVVLLPDGLSTELSETELEAVLARGTAALNYVAGILKVCRMSFAGASGYAGVNGSSLESRMEHIMSVDLNRTSSRVARGLLGVVLGLVVLAPLGGGYLRAQQRPAGEQQIDPSKTARPLMVEIEELVKQGKVDEALQRLQGEMEKDPKRLDVRMALGNVAVRTGKYDLAVATFQDVLGQLDAGSTAAGDVYLRLGETYRRMGEFGPSIAALQHAGQLLPDSVVVHSTLALVLDGAGRWQEALEQYRKTLELAPNNAVALNNLAYLLSENKGSLDEALELVQRAREALPNLAEISDTLGWIYLKKNLTGDAIDVFEELVKRESQNPTFRYHLAMAYAQKGLKMSAMDQLKTALECSPKPEEAQKIRQLLNSLQN